MKNSFFNKWLWCWVVVILLVLSVDKSQWISIDLFDIQNHKVSRKSSWSSFKGWYYSSYIICLLALGRLPVHTNAFFVTLKVTKLKSCMLVFGKRVPVSICLGLEASESRIVFGTELITSWETWEPHVDYSWLQVVLMNQHCTCFICNCKHHFKNLFSLTFLWTISSEHLSPVLRAWKSHFSTKMNYKRA